MSKKNNFTQEQKHLIKQCMIDADIMGLSKLETIDYIKSRLGLNESFFQKVHTRNLAEVLNDESNNVQLISYYARQGFVEFYRNLIVEM